MLYEKASLCVVILTYNEEANIARSLDSVVGWAHQVFVLDSYSTDRTLEIAGHYPCEIVEHHFEDYARQRNFALEQLGIRSEWILFLDADEWLPAELKDEIASLIRSNPAENGFYINRRFRFMCKWIMRGYYPTWILRLFRLGKARCEQRTVNEHIIVEGKTGRLEHDFIHEDRKSMSEWIVKHNRYAQMEALELLKGPYRRDEIDCRFFGAQSERKRWLRHKFWNHLPLFVRPFIFFFYRYILRGGFLDGKAAFIYHFFQALWFPMLIDVRLLEMRAKPSEDICHRLT